MSHPADRISLQAGDLIVSESSGRSFLLLQRFKGEGGHYFWEVLRSTPLDDPIYRLEPIGIVREAAVRHNLYSTQQKFTLFRNEVESTGVYMS